jgi:OFA family oxalate/formate antiporter-like MFS transporter
VTGGALFMRNPPDGYRPPGWDGLKAVPDNRAGAGNDDRPGAANDNGPRVGNDNRPRVGNGLQAVPSDTSSTLGEALRTWQWYGLWLLLFLNTTAGIAVISQAAPMFQEITAISAARAASIVGVISIANGAGRLLWAWLSDLVGRRAVFFTMFALQAVIFALMPAAHGRTTFAALTIVVLLCYGGGFGTMPAFTADYFGAEYVGSIYGLMLTAWGVAGAVGPMLMAAMRERSGGYDGALRSIAALMVISAIIPLLVRPPTPTLREPAVT